MWANVRYLIIRGSMETVCGGMWRCKKMSKVYQRRMEKFLLIMVKGPSKKRQKSAISFAVENDVRNMIVMITFKCDRL